MILNGFWLRTILCHIQMKTIKLKFPYFLLWLLLATSQTKILAIKTAQNVLTNNLAESMLLTFVELDNKKSIITEDDDKPAKIKPKKKAKNQSEITPTWLG